MSLRRKYQNLLTQNSESDKRPCDLPEAAECFKLSAASMF